MPFMLECSKRRRPGPSENRYWGIPTKNPHPTVTSCVSPTNLLIFSDNSDWIGNHEVVDVLADLPEICGTITPDFLIYEAQKAEAQHKRAGSLVLRADLMSLKVGTAGSWIDSNSSQ